MAAVEQNGLFGFPVGSLPTTASFSETLDDQSNAFSSSRRGSTSSHRSALPAVAICGIGLRLPGGIRTGDDYWDLLKNRRDARGPVPPSRYSAEGFDDALGGKDGIKVKHGYFLDEELSVLDTSFFSLTKHELEKTDPQHRILLEVTRECLEDAGEVNYRGQLIGCYVGTFGDDWLLMSAKENAQAGGYMVTGQGDLMLANRVSYEYDFRGPSMAIKTGCSASLVALHEATRAIQNGDATAAIVGGTSLIMTPTLTATMAVSELLSLEGSCKTFDAAADGFARAEAITAIYIKRLDEAIRDGNPIRAVIRATATNSDGKGQSLVTPNGDAQEALMRKAYEEACLDPNETAFVECHGTGTATGDPIETNAVGRVFGGAGVFIGSVKPNLGHSEGSSGVSSVIKSVLALQHKTIPPNIKFNKPNSKIPFEKYNLKVPVVPTPFPSDRAERISINSFGIGGTNAHVILESYDHHRSTLLNRTYTPRAELLLLSAASDTAVNALIRRHEEFARVTAAKGNDIGYTRAVHREHLPQRAYVIVDNGECIQTATVVKAATASPPITMIFSGQGAQWPEMGKELIQTDINFRKDISRMDHVLQSSMHPPSWTILEELLKPADLSSVHKAELSQPLCTAIQVALVNKYSGLGVSPDAVVGHSSGEIAAAYAAGYLSMDEAIIIAYYRGYVTTKQSIAGGMAAIGLGAHEVTQYLQDGVVLACENSPNSSTISGDASKVDDVVEVIKTKVPDILARPLKVDIAYHSHHMTSLSQQYKLLLEEDLKARGHKTFSQHTSFFSSVTCKLLDNSPLAPSYWVQNLTSPVRFSSAVTNLLALSEDGVFLEIGPHSALAGPLRQICAAQTRPCNYISALTRDKNCRVTFLSSVGQLYQNGVSMNFAPLYPNSKAIPGLPTYPWDHNTSYWHESRVSKAWRTRQYPHHCLLGTRVVEAPDTEPQWRNILCLDDEPWLTDHKIQSDVVFPFAGYVALAGEAVRQVTQSPQGVGYRLRHVVAHTALLLTDGSSTELVTTLRHHQLNDTEISDWYEFSVFSCSGSKWIKHCDGRVALLQSTRVIDWKPETLPRTVNCSRFYEAMAKTGFVYGPEFRGLTSVTTSTTEELAIGQITHRSKASRALFTLHPAVIDACLQLLLAARCKGLNRNISELSVPISIEDLEIASGSDTMTAKAWNLFNNPENPCIECIASDGSPILHASGLQLRSISDDHATEELDIHAAARLQWLPDFDFIDAGKLFTPPTSDRRETTLHEELALLCILESAAQVRYLSPCQSHFAKFRDWLNQQVGAAAAGAYELVPTSKTLAALSASERQRLIDDHVTALTVPEMGRAAVTTGVKRILDNVADIFTGKADTLDILLQDGVLARIYDCIGFDYSDFIRTISHTRPQLRILEVGAGTGGTTQTILKSLADVGGLPAYAKYTFTDVSAGFFPTAKERFAYAKNLEFKVFDISDDPFEQGFVPGSYDLILAANVIHATPSLQATLRNLQPLLREDGMLVMTEICTVSRGPSYIFGNFSGWWLGEADGRPDKPHVPVERWDADLKASGFTGVDAAVYDEEQPYAQCAVIVSKKNADLAIMPQKVAILSTDPGGETVHPLTTALHDGGWEITHFKLPDDIPKDHDIISCLDLETNFFQEITADTLAAFQNLLRKMSTQKLLWLTTPSQVVCTDPRSAQTLGVARTIRSELALSFNTLEITHTEPDFSSHVLNVFNKIRIQEDNDNLESDKEFAISNGTICIGRYHPFHLKDELKHTSSASNIARMKYLDIGKPGILETLSWKIHPLAPDPIPNGRVELDVRSCGLNFRDVVYAMGLLAWTDEGRLPLGMEVGGVVSRVSNSKTGLKPGDRVMGYTHEGGFATQAVLKEEYVLKIPDSMTFAEAATIQGCYGTVVYALLDVARLKRGMSVLIHSACGGVGLAAMQVCQMIGAEVYATVGSDHKVKHLMEHFGLSRGRIFFSRNTSFLDGIMNDTSGKGVDIVLNSLPGELLHASWKCVAKNGTFLELGKRDLTGFGKLDMSRFLDNRSYCGVDIAYLVRERPLVVRETLQRTLDFIAKGLLKPLDPITEFAAADAKQAFRHLQGGTHIGKIILTMPTDTSELEASVSSQPLTFHLDATYMLVGGAGGLGRSLAIWLIERGARHLVFLSRSAGETDESRHLSKELESMGCSVTMVSGSVNHMDDVKKAIAAATTPIKGVFHLAMVQKDAPVIDMSWTDWDIANKPKVDGTWNLHKAFLDQSLDFFWLASSTVTVVDQPGQGNYKAGSTFIEAFCQYRHSLGLPASVLSICPIDDVGYVAENQYALRNGKSQGLYFLGEKEFLDSVEATLLNNAPPQNSSSETGVTWQSTGHIVMGLRSELHLDDPKNTTNWRRDRRMGMYHNIPLEEATKMETESSILKQFLKSLVDGDAQTILSDEDNIEFLAVETGRKIYDFLLKPDTAVDTSFSLSQIGLDSLTAIELRRWFRQAFGLQISVLEIMGSASLRHLGQTVAGKLNEKHAPSS